MATFDDYFRSLNNGKGPYDYQRRVAERYLGGGHLILRAPTGAGKTLAAFVPFLLDRTRGGPTRLIYALPLRTLTQAVFREAQELVARAGGGIEVTLQTGEAPGDPFFNAQIVVTTYDQVLSGLLCAPYGLSSRLHNVNAASVAGALVVFDEFHLMQPDRAFLTAAAMLNVYRDACQSIWMTATATNPACDVIRSALSAETIDLTAEDLLKLPSVASVDRRLRVEGSALSAAALASYRNERLICVVNTVRRAQQLYVQVRAARPDALLLHSRFFQPDRAAKEAGLQARFGRDGKGPALLIATQVVEAGLDLSCDHLHTELAPMNSIVQRAGRCARFAGEAGIVHIHPLPEQPRAWLPYTKEGALERTEQLLNDLDGARIEPRAASDWVEQVHRVDDEAALDLGFEPRRRECMRRIQLNAFDRQDMRVADLIRGDNSDQIRVIVANSPPAAMASLYGVSLSRWSLSVAAVPGQAWAYDASAENMPWRPVHGADDLRKTYAVCLRPTIARYTAEVGLEIGSPGNDESPPRTIPPRPGIPPYRREGWLAHAQKVEAEALRRLDAEFPPDTRLPAARSGMGVGDAFRLAVGVTGFLHDLGKLNASWQRWAEAAQKSAEPGYEYREPLAHTNFDSANEADRARERNLAFKRPYHAAQGAFLAGGLFSQMLAQVPTHHKETCASAIAAAITSHHGGWVHGDTPLHLHLEGLGAIAEAELAKRHLGADGIRAVLRVPNRKAALLELLKITTGADELLRHWPLVAYLMRTLRLSDQRATAEHSHG